MPPARTRRSFLTGLAALGAVGCVGRSATPEPLTEYTGGVMLGYRLATGADLHTRVQITRESATGEVTTAQRWRYQVRRLDDSFNARLVATLLGDGRGARLREHELDTSSLPSKAGVPLAAERITLGLDGRVHALTPSTLQGELPHYLLAMAFPRRPLFTHDEWTDLDLVRRFAEVLPNGLVPTVTGLSRIVDLSKRTGQTLAVIETTGRVRAAQGGAQLEIDSTTTWDVERGLPLQRALTARFTPTSTTLEAPGTLRAQLTVEPS